MKNDKLPFYPPARKLVPKPNILTECDPSRICFDWESQCKPENSKRYNWSSSAFWCWYNWCRYWMVLALAWIEYAHGMHRWWGLVFPAKCRVWLTHHQLVEGISNFKTWWPQIDAWHFRRQKPRNWKRRTNGKKSLRTHGRNDRNRHLCPLYDEEEIWNTSN